MPKLDLGRGVGMSQAKRSREGGAEECSRQKNSFAESGRSKTADAWCECGLGRAGQGPGTAMGPSVILSQNWLLALSCHLPRHRGLSSSLAGIGIFFCPI